MGPPAFRRTQSQCLTHGSCPSHTGSSLEWLRIPAVPCGARSPTARCYGPSVRPAKRVLIVEDDAAIRGLREDVLRAEAYAVVVARSGLEALEQMRRNQPDLVL